MYDSEAQQNVVEVAEALDEKFIDYSKESCSYGKYHGLLWSKNEFYKNFRSKFRRFAIEAKVPR